MRPAGIGGTGAGPKSPPRGGCVAPFVSRADYDGLRGVADRLQHAERDVDTGAGVIRRRDTVR